MSTEAPEQAGSKNGVGRMGKTSFGPQVLVGQNRKSITTRKKNWQLNCRSGYVYADVFSCNSWGGGPHYVKFAGSAVVSVNVICVTVEQDGLYLISLLIKLAMHNGSNKWHMFTALFFYAAYSCLHRTWKIKSHSLKDCTSG